MLKEIDGVLGRYPHIIAALEAIGTVAAVIVSLVLAFASRRAHRTPLRAEVTTLQLFVTDTLPSGRPGYTSVSVTNTGILALRIPFAFFYWKIPLYRTAFLVKTLDHYPGNPDFRQRSYPVEIQPNTTETFSISTTDRTAGNLKDIYQQSSALKRFLFRFSEHESSQTTAPRLKPNSHLTFSA